MKKTIFFLAITAFIVGTVIVSCKSATKGEIESLEKVGFAEQNFKDVKDSFVVAQRAASVEEWQSFKNRKDYEVRIAELELEMQRTGKSVDAKYQKNIDILDQKNKDFKVTTATFKNDANTNWQSFKREFRHDMAGIGQAFKDVTVDNKK